jgi:hypothetical protein
VPPALRCTPLAARDVATASQWYEAQRLGLGAEFEQALATSLARTDMLTIATALERAATYVSGLPFAERSFPDDRDEVGVRHDVPFA